jgi:TonB family protein
MIRWSAMRTLVLLAMLLAPIAAEDAIRVNLPLDALATGAWHFAKTSVELPRDVVSPKLTSAPPASPSKIPAPDSFVAVSFQINEKGLPVSIQVDKSSDKELEAEVIALIREWRFEAALRGVTPVVAEAHVELSGSDLHNGRPRPHHRVSPVQQ